MCLYLILQLLMSWDPPSSLSIHRFITGKGWGLQDSPLPCFCLYTHSRKDNRRLGIALRMVTIPVPTHALFCIDGDEPCSCSGEISVIWSQGSRQYPVHSLRGTGSHATLVVIQTYLLAFTQPIQRFSCDIQASRDQ